MKKPITIATRPSPLALAQTNYVRAALCQAHGLAGDDIVLYEIITKGDKILDKPLADIGGKGLFTEELNRALCEGDADIAVHSLKDLPTQNEAGLTIAAIPPRGDPYDMLISKNKDLAAIKKAGVIGTASLRRQAQILHHRPAINIVPLRGNIGTRLHKLENDNTLDAIILAAAGLERLATLSLPPSLHMTRLCPAVLLPAAGQGALALQCRHDDTDILALCAPLICGDTTDCVTAERAALAGLDGSCRTPIAAFAQIKADTLYLQVRLLAKDGSEMIDDTISGARREARGLGAELAARLRKAAPHLIQKI
ncbi:MAG: hydroxymethylbilane synthase [Alphaproteobacteria bacterium]|nr:hydroxymethylbilane synthase [Alphaproteobacteria bacterium]